MLLISGCLFRYENSSFIPVVLPEGLLLNGESLKQVVTSGNRIHLLTSQRRLLSTPSSNQDFRVDSESVVAITDSLRGTLTSVTNSPSDIISHLDYRVEFDLNEKDESEKITKTGGFIFPTSITSSPQRRYVKKITAGVDCIVLLTDDKKAYSLDFSRSRKTLTLLMNDVVDCASGCRHILLLNSSGDVFSAGDNRSGQLGHSLHNSFSADFRKVKPVRQPKKRVPQICAIKSVYALGYGSCALGENGRVCAFGFNNDCCKAMNVPIINPHFLPKEVLDNIIDVHLTHTISFFLNNQREILIFTSEGHRPFGSRYYLPFKLSLDDVSHA